MGICVSAEREIVVLPVVTQTHERNPRQSNPSDPRNLSVITQPASPTTSDSTQTPTPTPVDRDISRSSSGLHLPSPVSAIVHKATDAAKNIFDENHSREHQSTLIEKQLTSHNHDENGSRGGFSRNRWVR